MFVERARRRAAVEYFFPVTVPVWPEQSVAGPATVVHTFTAAH
ncbi:hypothetical protein FAIPA1_60170 [Frankia sp. AiPs1]